MASNSDTTAITDISNVKRLTVVCLRQELSKRGLSSAGLKPALVQRLEEALQREGKGEVQADGEEDKEEETNKSTEENDEDMTTDSDDERGLKRKRVLVTPHDTTTSPQSSVSDELNSLYQELKAADKEKERMQFKLEEALARIEQAKQEGRKEAEQDLSKERFEMKSQMEVAMRKREELEFKLSQKDDELREYAASKTSETKENQQIKLLKEQLKKKESLEFQCEQMKEQVTDYKQQVRVLQQKIETMQLHIDRDKKEKERSLQEERGKTESIRMRMESQQEDLVKEWRKEFEKKMEDQQEALRQQLRETKKLQKELAEKKKALDEELVERTKDERQRLSDLQAELLEKENQILENDKLQEEIDVALEQRSRSLEEESARLESDKQEFEQTRNALEKERQELEDRLWAIDLDVKRRTEKEKALDNKVMELLGTNEALAATISSMKEAHAKQVQELSQENERLSNSLALSQARIVAGRPVATPATSSTQQPKQDKLVDATDTQNQVEPSTSRQTRSQARSQEQQSRDTLLTKTRSRASYIPKPSTRKTADTAVSLLPKPNSSNKENSLNTNEPEVPPIPEPSETPARKQRASMIPIRRGSSLLQVSRS